MKPIRTLLFVFTLTGCITPGSPSVQDCEGSAPKASMNDDSGAALSGAGGLTVNDIMGVIRANLKQIRDCYRAEIARDANAKGKLTTRFVIGKSGSVASVCIYQKSATIKSPDLQQCITDKIADWKFPNPRKQQEVTVNYPFIFSPAVLSPKSDHN